MLRQWLAQTSVIPDEDESEESKLQKKELETKQSDPVLESTVQYCLRILEQCDRSMSRIICISIKFICVFSILFQFLW